MNFVSGAGLVMSAKRAASALFAVLLTQLLAGCLLATDKVDPALDIPAAYDAGPRSQRAAEAALPKLDWWHAFRSRELTGIVEQARDVQSRHRGRDCAHRAGRRASAHRRRRLLPTSTRWQRHPVESSRNIDNTGVGGSERRRRPRPRRLQRVPDRKLRDRLLGQEPLRIARRRRKCGRQPATTAKWSRSPPSSPPPTPISRCWRRKTGCGSRAKTSPARHRVLNLIKQRLEAGTASELETAQQESLVNTQRAAIPPLEQTLRQNRSRSRC